MEHEFTEADLEEHQRRCRENELRDTPSGWAPLWTIWGVILASLIGWLDQSLLGLTWLLGGILIDVVGWPLLLWLTVESSRYYTSFREPMPKDPTADARAELGDYSDSEEQIRWWKRNRNYETHAVPPLTALFIGVLIGPILGTLLGPFVGTFFGVAENSGYSAILGALWGLIIAPVVLGVLFAVQIAWLMEFDDEVSPSEQRRQRWLMIASPILFVPALWYCLCAFVSSQWTSE